MLATKLAKKITASEFPSLSGRPVHGYSTRTPRSRVHKRRHLPQQDKWSLERQGRVQLPISSAAWDGAPGAAAHHSSAGSQHPNPGPQPQPRELGKQVPVRLQQAEGQLSRQRRARHRQEAGANPKLGLQG